MKTITFWDMIYLYLQHFYFDLNNFEARYQKYWSMNEAESKMRPTENEFETLKVIVGKLKVHLVKLEAEKTLTHIGQLEGHIHDGIATYFTLQVVMQGVWHTVATEMGERVLAYLPKDRMEYLEAADTSGLPAITAFPAATKELKSAGNCLVVDLPDAAIFHSCRAAEIGLRALAKKLSVTLSAPLEFKEWGNVIKAIDDKIEALDGTPRGATKAAELELYSNCSSDCRAIKDTWRDSVFHTRASFNYEEALGVYKRVCELLIRLASNNIT